MEEGITLLLAALEGDMIQRIGHPHTTRILRDKEIYEITVATHRVVERDGKPFFWPQTQEV